MKYRKLFLTCIIVIGLNNCGGSSATNEIDSNNENENNPITTEQPTSKATVVNNEAISFPKSANQTSVPTDQLPKN